MRLDGTLPWATTALLSMSSFMQKYGWLGLLAVPSLPSSRLQQYFSNAAGRRRFDEFRLEAVW